MTYRCNILLGRITKISGYEGAVLVRLENIYTDNIPALESVFLEIEGRPVPFFISGLEYSGGNILKLSFQGYDSIGKINEFLGCRIFLTSDFNFKKMTAADESLIGYRVCIQENEILGSISEVLENNGQWLIKVMSINNKEILIPFHDHFIVSLDKKKKVIIMNIPEGLTAIN